MVKKETFGQRVKRLRRKKGLSQWTLAKLADMRTETVSRIERDENEARDLTRTKLAGVLGAELLA